MEKENTFKLTQVDDQRILNSKLSGELSPLRKISSSKFSSKTTFEATASNKENETRFPKIKELKKNKSQLMQSFSGSPKIQQIKIQNLNGRRSPDIIFRTVDNEEDSNQQFIKETKQLASQELQQLYQGSPKILFKAIRKVESSRNITDYISTMHSQIINLKNVHSKLKFERELKEQHNQKIHEIIQDLGQIKSETTFWQKSLDEIESRYAQMQYAVENEMYQQSRLQHLINQKRTQIAVLKKPISDLRQELTKRQIEIQEETQKVTLKKRQLTEKMIEKQKEITDLEQNQLLNQQKQGSNQQVLKEYFLFQGIFEKEKELDLEQKKKQLEEKKSQYRQILAEREKDEQTLEDEMQKNQEYIRRQDKMFKKISEVTNINNIAEMLPHLNYLESTFESLKKSKEELHQKIKNYHENIEQLTQELQQLKFSSNGAQFSGMSRRE